MKELELLKKKQKREIAARKQAELILESKALELYKVNQELKDLNETLEEQVQNRTKQLKESESKYRSILENMEIGILEVDKEGLITRAFPRFCDLIGYEAEEMIGRDPIDFLLVQEFIPVIAQQQSDREKGIAGIYEVQLKKKDGNIIWVLISGAPFFNENDELIGTIGVHYDITEQKLLREKLVEARDIAERAKRAQQNFLSSTSHEIRTPLNAIIGMTHLLKDSNLDQEQKEHLEILDSSANILLTLISDILDISKIDAGKVEIKTKPINLQEILKFIEKTFSVKLDSKPVSISVEMDPAIDTLLIGDELLINQILLNLVSNAAKFTHDGFVHLRANVISKDNDHTTIKFEVEDTGIGISKSELENIFHDFKQADSDITRKYGGTGLGLAITKRLVELLNGSISCDSELGKGSYFSVELEFGNTDLKPTKVSSKPSYQVAIKTDIKPVLIVEDNKVNEHYIRKLFERWGLPFKICNNGYQAIEMCNIEAYSIILMDLQMPKLSGFDAASNIIEQSIFNSKTPIVALSASSTIATKERALKAGMVDFLPKPFTPEQLNYFLSKYLIDSAEESETKISEPQLEEIQEIYGDDWAYAFEMFELFEKSFNNEFPNLKEHFDSGDIDSLRKLVHKIKPTFTMVGMPSYTILFDKIENACEEQNHAVLEKLFKDFIKQKEDIVSQVRYRKSFLANKMTEK